jgi:HEAT repeat protein
LAAHAVWEGLFSLRPGHEATEPVTPDEGLLRSDLVTALIDGLRAGRGTTKDEEALRYWVCRAFMELGPLAAVAIPALEEILVEVASGAELAAGALGHIGGAALPALIRALSHPNNDVRRAAAKGLGRAGRYLNQEAISALERATADQDEFVMIYATEALGAVGPAAISALCNVLRDRPDPEGIYYHVAQALIRVRDVGILARLMKDDSVHVRRTASYALTMATFEEIDWNAIPALAEAMLDEDGQVRENAARALERIGRFFKTEPATLQPAREALIFANAIPALAEALRDEDGQVRENAARALATIGGFFKTEPATLQPAREALIFALEDRMDVVRSFSILALACIRHEAVTLVPLFVKRLADEDALVRRFAAEGLERMGKHASAAVPVLIDALGDRDWLVKARVIDALTRIGRGARTAVPAIWSAIQGGDTTLRPYLLHALKRIDPDEYDRLAETHDLDKLMQVDPADYDRSRGGDDD